MTPATNAQTAEINVTPMLDVLLVLLIIFLAASINIVPVIEVQLPEPCGGTCAAGEQIVLEVLPGPAYAINHASVPAPDLLRRIASIYAGRPDKSIEVAAARGVRYDDVVHAIDVAKSASVRVVGLLPKATPEGVGSR